MITQKHISQVVDSINEWRKEKHKIIIGIDGYSGVGKTTLLKGVNDEIDDVLIVHRDDFIIERRDFDEKFQKSKDKVRTLEYGVVDVDELRKFLNQYKSSNDIHEYKLRDEKTGKKEVAHKFDFSKQILIMEGVFLFHPNQFDDLFDRRIFLDADQESADERRRQREKERWGDDYFPDTHTDSYFRLTKVAFNNYLKKYKPEERADIVLKVD